MTRPRTRLNGRKSKRTRTAWTRTLIGKITTMIHPTELWPHQRYCIDEVIAAIARGETRILVTSPTGGGKTLCMSEIIGHYLERGKQIVLYTNRKLLVEQTSHVLALAGHTHGVRAAGWSEQHGLPLQVSSIQTEQSRVLKAGTWRLHDADLALIDEAHL